MTKKQKEREQKALDAEAIAYDRCARALSTMTRRMHWGTSSSKAAGRILSSLADRFDAKFPAALKRAE